MQYSKVRSQQGQILPVAVASAMMLLALMYLIFNTFQVTSSKAQLSNAADAAAYSGAVWQARSLNFQSYTNRAMVANHVAMAQAMSVLNWTRYADTTAENIDTLANIFPPIKAVTTPIAKAAEQLKIATEALTGIYIPAVDKLNAVLSQSQKIMYQATKLVTADVVRDVVKKNNDHYELSPATLVWLVKNGQDWATFTKSYSDKESIERKSKIVAQSTDAFTAGDRNQVKLRLYLGLTRRSLRKSGYTRLQEYAQDNDGDPDWQWKSKDSLELVNETFRCNWRGRCGWKITNETPIGWAQTQMSTTGEDIDQDKQQAWSANKKSEAIALLDAEDEDQIDGFRSYYDMANLDKDDEESHDQRLVLKVEVLTADQHIRSASNLEGIGSAAQSTESRSGLGKGSLYQAEDYADGVVTKKDMSSFAVAEVYFERPVARKQGAYGARDNLKEYSNLFNPYWHVRLLADESSRKKLWGEHITVLPSKNTDNGSTPGE